MTAIRSEIKQLAINTIRTLSIDMVEKANSGHPGMPMGAAPMAYALWAEHMAHNPANPAWFNRDRFVLSAGHGSALLYSLLHLFGYGVSIEDLQQFRQWGSKTPGHPEYGHTPGVEVTTGPLGQGISMAVGLAMAEAHLASVYNRGRFPVVDHFTYVICGDGDLMEGVAAEAASLAGHLGLGKLIVLYDSNDISLDGDLNMSFSEQVGKRFEAYGWQYLRVEEGMDAEAVGKAIDEAKSNLEQPTLIEIKTIIGYGSKHKAGTSAAHGAPLGEAELGFAKEAYGWKHEPFVVPDEAREHFAHLKLQGEQREAAWNRLFESYEEAYPELAALLRQSICGELPQGWSDDLPFYEEGTRLVATREASGTALNAIARRLPALIGGSADLASSNNTLLKAFPHFGKGAYAGRNIWFGVREHAMGAMLNGLSVHGGLRPFGGTFLVFSDYLRPAIRMSAMMKQPVVYVFTHDSIAVGEDGPTHEPIEQIPSLRLIPSLIVFRPADANETMHAYKYALSQNEHPAAMILSRQKLPVLPGTRDQGAEGIGKGAYVLADAADSELPQAVLLATGSEVSLAMEAHRKLAGEGIATRVVSMPSLELFERQPQAYKDSVLLPQVKHRIAIEMAHPFGWERYAGTRENVIGIDTYGASGPGERVMAEFGFTAERVVEKIKHILVQS